MSTPIPPGLEKKINAAVEEHFKSSASANPRLVGSSEAKEVPTNTKSQPKTTTTQPPQLSAQDLTQAHQIAQAEASARTQPQDKQFFSALGGHLKYHQLDNQYLLSVKPVGLGVSLLCLPILIGLAGLTLLRKLKSPTLKSHPQ
jgi:hypothetical protein